MFQTAILTYSNVFTIYEDLGKDLSTTDGSHGVALIELDGAVNLGEGYVLSLQQILDGSDVLLSSQHASGRGGVEDDFARHSVAEEGNVRTARHFGLAFWAFAMP